MTAEYNHTPSITSYQLATAGDKDSLESSGGSSTSDHKKYTIDMKLINEKAKQLSLDSAYTSEADLDASHNSTATNSRSASPKLSTMTEKAEEEVAAAKEEKKEDKMEDKKPESDDGEAKEKAEEEQVKDKPLEFAPKENSFSSPAPLSPSGGVLFQQPSPQAYYHMSPQYISPPLSPLVIPMQQQQQQQPYFTFVPAQDVPQMQLAPVGNAIMQQRQL